MKRFYILLALLTLGLLALPSGNASAQSFTFGPHLIYDLDVESLGVGAQARANVNLGGYALILNPSLEYYFMDDGEIFDENFSQSLMQLNVDLLYQFQGTEGTFSPYAGAGLAIARYSYDYDAPGLDLDDSNTDTGLNLIAGATMNAQGSFQPFGQAYLTVGDGTRIGVKVGVMIGGGSR